MKRAARKARKAHIYKRHPDDWYVEESWVSARFFALFGHKIDAPLLDPFCGFGQIVLNARAAGIEARGSDIKPRWRRYEAFRPSHERLFRTCDFLNGHWPPKASGKSGKAYEEPQVIMGNPPFRKVHACYEAAIARASHVIFLLPATWVCGAETSAWLETTPLKCVYPLGPRASMPPGDYILAGNKPQGGRADHAWYEWQRGITPFAHGGRRPELQAIRREDISVRSAAS